MFSKWLKMSRLHPFEASITYTHTQMQNKKKLSNPWCCQMLNIWWEEHSAYHRSRSHQYELIQVQAAELSMLSNSALREVDPHLSTVRGEKNLFLYLQLQPESENTSSKTLALKEYIHSLHRHRGKTWHLYLYQHVGLTLRLLSLIPRQMSHHTCIKQLLKNHWGCT